MVTVPFPPFEPDKNKFNMGALPTVLNVVPLADGWGPLRGITNVVGQFVYLTTKDGNRLTTKDGRRLISGPTGVSLGGGSNLPGDCIGFFAARKEDGTETLFAGTAEDLYLFNSITFNWEVVTRLSGTYAAACRWSFVKFGSVVYAQNGFDEEQMFDIETDTEFSDNTTAPICKYLAVVGDFVFRGNIVSWASEGYGAMPAMIQWSAINNPQDNTPQNFNMSDFQVMPTGDEVMGIVPLSGGCHVWMRSALHGMQQALTSEYVFTRTPIDEMRGISAPYAIGIIGQDDYTVYCDDGLWRFKGGFGPIGQGRVNNWWLGDCDQDERENILAMSDPENAIVWWGYTDTAGERKMLGYHYNLDRFTLSDIAIAASTRARTFAYTEPDPPILTTDLLRFAIIDPNGQLGYLVGRNLAATIVTNEAQFAPDRSFVNNVALNGDPVTFTVTPSTTNVKGGDFRTRSAASPSARSGNVPIRADGRTHVFQLDIPLGEDWTNVSGLEAEAVRAGRS